MSARTIQESYVVGGKDCGSRASFKCVQAFGVTSKALTYLPGTFSPPPPIVLMISVCLGRNWFRGEVRGEESVGVIQRQLQSRERFDERFPERLDDLPVTRDPKLPEKCSD